MLRFSLQTCFSLTLIFVVASHQSLNKLFSMSTDNKMGNFGIILCLSHSHMPKYVVSLILITNSWTLNVVILDSQTECSWRGLKAAVHVVLFYP